MQRTVRLIFTVGISGSGKSTWANEALRNLPNGRVLERDQIRRSIVWEKKHEAGNIKTPFRWNEWNWKWEDRVTQIWNDSIDGYISGNKVDTIICSDTNLDIQRLHNTIDQIKKRHPDVILNVEIKQFPVSYEEAVKRDANRTTSVGAFVIGKQYARYCQMTKAQASKNVEGAPKAIIIDLDGTFAINTTDRGHYDDHRYDEDSPNLFLKNMIRMMSQIGYIPLFLSGREATPVGREKTESWLEEHVPSNLIIYKLFMREHKDHRPDEIVKEEIYWREIDGRYNVEAVFDDRPKVARMWRSIGLSVYQCGDPHVEF